jgi:sugar phosphate isomerase/epimerase
MKGLACATLSCDGFENTNFTESLRLMPELGFQYVELNFWFASMLAPGNIASLAERLKRANLVPVAVYGAGFGGDGEMDLSRDFSHKLVLMQIARQLGCARIVATGAARGTKGGLEGLISVLKELRPVAEEWGITICLENHYQNNLEFIEDYEEIFDRIDSPNIGLCVDDGHFHASNVDFQAIIERLGRKIVHVHLKENREAGKSSFVRFGQGTTRHEIILNGVKKFAYDGFATIEFPPQQDGSTLREDLSAARSMFEPYVIP